MKKSTSLPLGQVTLTKTLGFGAIPTYSAPVEHVFSTAGESTTGKRNRLADRNLERKVLLRKETSIARLVVALACNHLKSALIVHSNYHFRSRLTTLLLF